MSRRRPTTARETARGSVGVDCTEISRWRALSRELRRGACRRLFSPAEHRHCRAADDPAARYAELWCAKEAVFKCLSPAAPLDLRRIEITFDAAGRARAVLPGARRGPVSGLSLCLTRAGDLALAVALRR